MNRHVNRGFTIVELLVVVSIIALLVGILLPAIGKARDTAKQSISQTNLRQLGQAHHTYSTEWNGRQFTLVDDSISRYGGDFSQAAGNYADANGEDPPGIILGWGTGIDGGYGLYGYWMNHGGNLPLMQPIAMLGTSGFGWFRMPNAKQFNQYLNGRYYDEVFYAPKDKMVYNLLDECFESPYEFTQCIGQGDTIWSSYCLSPAALYNPSVFKRDEFTNPWDMDAGHRVPGFDMALFSDLKTHMLEHHWLQQTRSDCNPAFEEGTFDGCEPYYFNLAFESVPVSLFYDGHVESLGVREARRADNRFRSLNGTDSGLWSRDTPYGLNGYFHDVSYDTESEPGRGTSFHIFTTDGIRGRDRMAN